MSVRPATQVRPLRSEGAPRQPWGAELRLDCFRPRSKRCRRTDMKVTFSPSGRGGTGAAIEVVHPVGGRPNRGA